MSHDDTFYRSFADKRLTDLGRARRSRIEQSRLALLHAHRPPPGDLLEIGPGQGTLARAARLAGWRYRAIEPSPVLAEALRADGLDVIRAWTPPFPVDDGSCDVVYADQVMEHMNGVEQARAFVAEARRALRPTGVLFAVVPDYLKEREFFWDIDYTHNFVTTDRRMRQLLYDGGLEVERVVRAIGASTGAAREGLGAVAFVANLPGVDGLARLVGREEFLYQVRKNLFQTLAFVARKPAAASGR